MTSTQIFDAASLFMGCFALFFIAAGIYIEYHNVPISGVSQPNRYGQGGRIPHEFPGWAIISVGIFFAIVPLIDVYKFLKAKW